MRKAVVVKEKVDFSCFTLSPKFGIAERKKKSKMRVATVKAFFAANVP